MDFALGVLVYVASLAAGAPERDGGHVRATDSRLRAEINEGLARSPLFRQLVARLDGSDVIVYVQSECPMSPRIFGRLMFVGAGGGRRYLQARISCALRDEEQVVAIGHELRHAVEVADAPSVVDTASLGEEYRRIGFESRGVPKGAGYESRAAIDAARQVWVELRHTAE